MQVESKIFTRSTAVLALTLMFAATVLASSQNAPSPKSPDPPSVELPIAPLPPQQAVRTSSQEGVESDIHDLCWPDLFVDEAQGPTEVSRESLDKSLAASDPFESSGRAWDPDDVPPRGNAMRDPTSRTGTDWGKTSLQSMFFLGIMHSWRLVIEPDTRAELKGPFFKDYWDAVSKLRGWSDGDAFLTNYIGHPMMGSIAGRLLLQNQPQSREMVPEFKSEYAKSRLKAFGYAFLFSLQFEIGLVSEGTIGNAMPNEYTKHPFSYIDIAITPSVGTVWLIGEDLLDHYVIRRFEGSTDSKNARRIVRSLLNPTRSFANMMRLKKPWYRDSRSL